MMDKSQTRRFFPVTTRDQSGVVEDQRKICRRAAGKTDPVGGGGGARGPDRILKYDSNEQGSPWGRPPLEEVKGKKGGMGPNKRQGRHHG